MEEAGQLVQKIMTPIGTIVEDFGGKRIVLADLTTPNEILVLLHANHPDIVSRDQIIHSLDRKKRNTVTTAIRTLWTKKLIENVSDGFQLTRLGLAEAIRIIADLATR